MTKVYKIPLNAFGEQFDCTLNGKNLTFRTKWNDALGAWCLDIGNSSDDWLINNLALVSGSNLLEQYEHLELGFELYIVTFGKPYQDPTEDNLGTDAHLVAVIE